MYIYTCIYTSLHFVPKFRSSDQCFCRTMPGILPKIRLLQKFTAKQRVDIRCLPRSMSTQQFWSHPVHGAWHPVRWIYQGEDMARTHFFMWNFCASVFCWFRFYDVFPLPLLRVKLQMAYFFTTSSTPKAQRLAWAPRTCHQVDCFWKISCQSRTKRTFKYIDFFIQKHKW